MGKKVKGFFVVVSVIIFVITVVVFSHIGPQQRICSVCSSAEQESGR